MAKIPKDVAQLAIAHNRRLRLLDRRNRARLSTLSARASRSLQIALTREGVDASSFTAQQQRVALILAEVARMSAMDLTEEALLDALAQSTVLGLTDAITETQKWAKHFKGELRPININPVLQLDAGTLISRHTKSLATYGRAVELRVRQVLQVEGLSFTSKDAIVEAVQAAIGGERWRAERIMRTETLNAYNEGFHESLKAIARSGAAPDLMKTCIVTYDNRTAPDSLPLEGQIRALDEPFIDGEGRRYQHPPARPNDREKEVPYLSDSPPDDASIQPELMPSINGAPHDEAKRAIVSQLTSAANKRRARRDVAPLDEPPLLAWIAREVEGLDKQAQASAKQLELF